MSLSAARIARRRAGNIVFSAFCVGVTVVALVALAAILWSLLSQGLGGLNLEVFTKSTPAPGSPGGLANAIVGSIMMCVLAMVLAGVIGVLAGTWLAEYAGKSRYGSVVRFVNDVLLSAPTGSGKTLAAFLTCIDALVRSAIDGTLTDETSIVYVSPLKALGNDVQKNLDGPLAEIVALARSRGLDVPDIRTAVRTGDTLMPAREAMLRRPPHILSRSPSGRPHLTLRCRLLTARPTRCRRSRTVRCSPSSSPPCTVRRPKCTRGESSNSSATTRSVASRSRALRRPSTLRSATTT